MKKLICLFAFCISCMLVYPDTPGKAVNHDSKVSFQNIAAMKDYTCYWTTRYEQDTVKLINDSSLIVSGSGGAPNSGQFWAINKKTGASTDTLIFDNYYAPDVVVMVKEVKDGQIIYETTKLSNANKIISDSNTAKVENKELVKDAEKYERKHSKKIIWICSASVLAIGVLVWVFVRRKKKTV